MNVVMPMSLKELFKIPSVSSFLFDTTIDDALEAVLEKNQLDSSREGELVDLTDAVIDGLPMEEMPALIAQAFGVDEEKAKTIAADVAGLRLLPLRDFVPGVEAQIVAWGKRVEDYPQKKVGKQKFTADRLAGEIAERLGLEFSEVLIKRLGFLIKQYFVGEKSRESTLTFFSRAPSIGGLGISGDAAKAVLAEVDAIRIGAEIVEKEEEMFEAPQSVVEEAVPIEGSTSREHADQYLPEVAPSHELAAEVPVISGAVVHAVDNPAALRGTEALVEEAELAWHAKAASKVQAAAAPAKSALEDAVALSLDLAAPTLQAKRVAKKAFADLARAAIRGVRDLYQTREFFEREFGITGMDLEALTEAVEKGHAAYQGELKVEGGKLDVVETQDRQLAQREQEVLDKRFAAKTAMPPSVSAESSLPSAQVSAARTKEEELAIQEKKLSPDDLARAQVATRPTPIRPQLTVGSIPPALEGAPKVVTDVRAAAKLMGPVEQLGAMTPSEFRRLSTSPSEAVQKVEDVLLALEGQSYEERVRGIKAWRQSPINQLYLLMATQALKDGIPIAEVGSRRRAAGEESLSPAEIRAVATLNAKLRF